MVNICTNNVTKERDDQALFEANLGSIDSWGSLEAWQKGNPLGENSFHGGLISKPVTKSSAIRINTAIPMLC